MFFYIKEWHDKTATLMAKNGAVLWTFCSVEEAQQVCRDWYQVQKENGDDNFDEIVAYSFDEIIDDQVGLDPSCATCAMA